MTGVVKQKRISRSSMNETFSFLSDEKVFSRLEMVRSYVARPIPMTSDWRDPEPAWVENTSLLIGNKYHAANVQSLVRWGVTAVLNCASGGISRLPIDALQEKGIAYEFTNVRMDDYKQPILFDFKTRDPSVHLQVAKAVYDRVRQERGRVLFFCVAGQNRSATLGIAVLMLFGHSLEAALQSLSKSRPFVLENEGFQRQLVDLEAMLQGPCSKRIKLQSDTVGDQEVYAYANPPSAVTLIRSTTSADFARGVVEVELLIPGLCTMDVKIARESSIAAVKETLVGHANGLLSHYSSHASSDAPQHISKSWVVLAMFGYDDMYDFPLERELIEPAVQLSLLQSMFSLEVFTPEDSTEQHVRWNSKCRFALVIFSVVKSTPDGDLLEEPWTFIHEERPAAPATFLDNNLLSTHLRAWDFLDGSPLASLTPVVFSYSPDPRERRHFMKISTRANKPVQFHAPGEGGILGMGANAIVHRCSLGKVTVSSNSRELDLCPEENIIDAAVKRHFSFEKMVAFMENRSEAGLAKRIRLANMLNSDGRVVEFYGLGLALSSNSNNPHEFKFEAVLLAKYEEEFSTYTMKKFIADYLMPLDRVTDEKERKEVENLQGKFSLISVKVLLVSLLNAFRDLTLMGVQAFDFNHLSNVLVSRDHRNCRLIDIDGDSKGSIQLDESCDYIQRSNFVSSSGTISLHKPSLEIDLGTVLPTLVEQLILGKGRGRAFVTNKRSEIWKARPDDGRQLIMETLLENFYPNVQGEDETFKAKKHVHKVTVWFYACMKRADPWGNWTRDIYDAMRCIDHLPIA